MIAVAPVYVWRTGTIYHCNWSPRDATGKDYISARGSGRTPYVALANAQTDARDRGWKR